MLTSQPTANITAISYGRPTLSALATLSQDMVLSPKPPTTRGASQKFAAVKAAAIFKALRRSDALGKFRNGPLSNNGPI
jgi:hypothetical protein